MNAKRDIRAVIVERWDEFAGNPWVGVMTVSRELGLSRERVWNVYARLKEARSNLGLPVA